LLGNIRRGQIAKVKVIALERDQLCTLLEQGVAPVWFEIEVVFYRRSECFVRLCAWIGLSERAAESEFLSGLRLDTAR
jgi:hypothetical protein